MLEKCFLRYLVLQTKTKTGENSDNAFKILKEKMNLKWTERNLYR